MSLSFMQALAHQTGLPTDLIKTLLIMIINIPLAVAFRKIEKPQARRFWSLMVGLLSLTYLLQEWALYVLAAAVTPFILFKVIGRHHYVIGVVTSLVFLLFIHVFRFVYDYMAWKIDCSVSVMYLVTKVIYYGNFAAHHKHRIQAIPYLSYCFYFPTVLIGPTFNFTTFQDFIYKRNGYEEPKILIKPLMLQLALTISFGVATALLMPTFTPYWALQNEWYLGLSPFMKFLSLNIFGIIYRSKFYTAWGFTQIAVDISGLSWNARQQKYNAVRCGSAKFQVELNPRNKTVCWNTSVQIWLKQMFYDKVVSATKNTELATFVTFLVSALWHGIYLSYYIGFIQWAIIISISKWAYRMSQVLPKLANNFIAKAIAFIVASSLLNYTGMFIVILTWPQAIQCYKDLHFIGTFIMVTLLVASFVIRPSYFKSKHHKHAKLEGHPQANPKDATPTQQNKQKQRES